MAGLFDMHFDALLPALRNGQTTLLTLERTHGVTEQQVHDKALAAARAALTRGVPAGQWTQADADSVAADFTTHIYDYLAKIRNAVAAGRARLITGVQNNEWTQAQADDAALVFNETLDELLGGNLGTGMLGAPK